MAINIENDSGEYESIETIPTSGYVLSDDSYCNVNGSKDTSIKITYENGLIGISDITKKVKCTLYFDKPKAINTIIGDTTGIVEKTEFTGIATAADTGIYKAPDDYGTSYYFRGLEESLNNWIKFAGFYWRIIRINGNGTIRIIYSGVANGNPSSSNKTGTTTQINGTTYTYNHTYNDNAYVGYMMGIPLNGTAQGGNETSSHSTSYEQAHANIYNSDAKKTLDNWYKTNIENKNLSKYIDNNSGFCNDRELSKGTFGYTGVGCGTLNSAYAPLGRLYDSSKWKNVQTPTLQCTNKTRDLFTTNTNNIGNKALTYPIGLITSDEVVFAGGFGNKDNSTNYLYTSQSYITMSPYYYNGAMAMMFAFGSTGNLGNVNGSGQLGLRPVINLRADTRFTGAGSEIDPFVVV